MPIFEKRIYLLITAIILSFIPIILITFFSLQRIVNEERDLISLNSSQLFAVEKMRYLNSSQSAIMPIYVLSGEDRLLENLEQHHRDFHSTISELANTDSDSQYRVNLEGISKLSKRLKSLAAEGVLLKKKGASIDQVNKYFAKNTSTFSKELQQKLDTLSAKETKDLSEAKAHFSKTVDRVLFVLLFFLITSLVLVVFILRLVVKTMKQQAALFQKETDLSKARKEAVEVVAHDLKNPLATIKMSMELMASAEISSKIGLGMVQRSSEVMEKLIGNILDHAKIESGRLVLEKNLYGLDQVVRDIESRFQPMAMRDHIHIQSEIPNGLWKTRFDFARIEQVLSNLLGNALKFTPKEGEVKIKLASSSKDFLISVEDNGPGIDLKYQKSIFERNWQDQKTANQGNGLGLAIAKTIVEAHHGKIWVESVKGQGAKFFVRLPLDLSSEQNA